MRALALEQQLGEVQAAEGVLGAVGQNGRAIQGVSVLGFGGIDVASEDVGIGAQAGDGLEAPLAGAEIPAGFERGRAGERGGRIPEGKRRFQ